MPSRTDIHSCRTTIYCVAMGVTLFTGCMTRSPLTVETTQHTQSSWQTCVSCCKQHVTATKHETNVRHVLRTYTGGLVRFTICAKTKHNKKLIVSKRSAFRWVNQSWRTLTSLLARKKEQRDNWFFLIISSSYCRVFVVTLLHRYICWSSWKNPVGEM